MKDNNDFSKNFKRIFPYGLMTFLIVFSLMCLYFVMRYWSEIAIFVDKVTGILQPVIFGMVLAYLINPIVCKVESNIRYFQLKHKALNKINKFNRAISIFIAYFVVFVLFYLVLKIIIPGVQESVLEIVETFPEKMNALWSGIDSHIRNNKELESTFKTAIDELSALVKLKSNDITEVFDIASKVFASLRTFVYFILNFIIGIIVSLYILAEKEKFKTIAKKITYALFPMNFSNGILKTAREVDRIFSGFVIGKIIDSIIIGFICYIAMLILRLPYAVLISVIIGITNVIPFFGPFIGAIPSALIIFLTDPIKGFYFLLMIIVLQQLDGNVIGPKILGDKTGLSSFWVVFAILLSGGLFGFTGMLLGVPVFASIYYIISVFVNKLLVEKGLPENTTKYNNLVQIQQDNAGCKMVYSNQTEVEDTNETKKG